MLPATLRALGDPRPFLAELARSHAVETPAIRAGYAAGKLDRLTRNWIPGHHSGDSAIAATADLLLQRVRDQGRNEPSLVAARRVLVDQIVGCGLRTNAAAVVRDGSGTLALDDEFNEEADEIFDQWAEEEADAAGRLTWYAIQRQVLSETIEAGECLLVRTLIDEPDRSVPLAFQVVEAELIDVLKDWPASAGRAVCRRGIEYDAAGRPIAYWLRGQHPSDSHGTFGQESARIEASRVLHYFIPQRPTARRGVSWFAAAMRPARDRDWLLGNVLTAAAIQAIFTVVQKSQFPGSTGLGFTEGAGTDGSDTAGNPLVKLGRGVVSQIGPNDEISTVAPTQPGQNFDRFMQLILQEEAMATGLSYLRLTRDYSKTNYSSARAAHNDDYRTTTPLAEDFGQHLVARIRRQHTAMAAAGGLYASVSPTQFAQQRRRWQRLELLLPPRLQIDEVKETEAARMRIAAGLSTLKDEAGKIAGRNWRSVILQRQREVEFARARGVPIDLGGAAAIAVSPDDEPIPDEDE